MFKKIISYGSMAFVLSSCISQPQNTSVKLTPTNIKPTLENTKTESVNVEFVPADIKSIPSIESSTSSYVPPQSRASKIVVFNQNPQTLSSGVSERLNAPFNLALKSVEDYITNWLLRPSEVSPVEAISPVKPDLPGAPILTKGEFETTKQFETRLAQEKFEYNKSLNNIKQKYIDEVRVYNAAVNFYNNELEWERKRRQEQANSMRTRLLNTAINEVLGVPRLTNLQYNADQEIFDAKVISENSAISYDVLIPVAIGDAQIFKQDSDQATVAIKMSLKGKIKPVNFRIDSAKGSYTAYLAKDKVDVVTKQRSAGVENIDLSNIVIDEVNSLKVDDIVDSNEKYFGKLF